MRNFGSIPKINRRVLLSGVALLPTLFGSARAIAQAQPATALDSGKEGHAGPPIKLTPSGSITVATNFQIIENKLITGKITVNGKNGVVIRNCQINHPGDVGIDATSCTNLTIQDCKVVNTSAATGLKPNPDEVKNIQLLYGGPHTIKRVYVQGAGGIFAYRCTGALNVSFLEGHGIRGCAAEERGQLIQMVLCKGGLLMEDFSAESDVANSWTSDIISLYQCLGSHIFRRGLVDGNNHPAGCAYMVQDTPGVLFEDCDAVRQGNGAFAVYSGTGGSPSSNVIYRRCRARDTIQKDVGRGPIASNYVTYISSPGCVGTRFEQCQHFNVLLSNLAWDVSTMAVMDWVRQDFTPRAPIRNKFGWDS